MLIEIDNFIFKIKEKKINMKKKVYQQNYLEERKLPVQTDLLNPIGNQFIKKQTFLLKKCRKYD